MRSTSADLTRSAGRRPGEQDAAECGAAQPILVVHRRLVHEIRERAVGVRGPVAKENQVLAAQDGDRRVVRRDVDQQPVRGGRLQARQHGVDDVEGRQVHDAGVRADFRADALVAFHDVAPRDRDDELLSLAGAGARQIAELRVVDGERRGFLDLPAHQLIEILTAGGHLLESHERYLRHRIGNDEADPPGSPAESIEEPAERADDRRAIVNVRCRQRRDDRARRAAARWRARRWSPSPTGTRLSPPTGGVLANSTATAGGVAMRSVDRMLIRRR